MAAMDDCPTVNEGQSWSSCSDSFGFKCSENDEDDDDSENEKNAKQGPVSDAMKLRKEDMGLFGFCPTWDDFYLVVCEVCGHVVKPQALKSHIELRHSSTALPRCERPSVPTQHGKNSSSSKSSSSSFHMPLVSGKLPVVGTAHGVKSSSTMTPGHSSSRPPLKVGSSHSHRGHSGGASATSQAVPIKQSKPVEGTLGNKLKNHSIEPVVRVERIPQSLMMKKAVSSLSSHAPVNSVVTDKKELPSPQQPPPPVSPVTNPSSVVPGSLVTNSSNGGSAGHVLQTVVIDVERSQPVNKKSSSVSSKSKKASKERKLLPCKDREYDANKHCGVLVAESGKPCTRSLTCKTHSLSLRRAVVGRKKAFDELLFDHRAAKEASLKAQGKSTANDTGGETHNSTISSLNSKSCQGSNRLNSSAALQRSSTVSSLKNSKSNKSTPTIPFSRSASSPGTGTGKELSEQAQQRLQGESGEHKISYPDPSYVNHHPKPAALCTFGMRQLGNGLFLINRHWDLPRAAFRATVCSERGVHPPPLKKLCLESRLPPVPETVDPSDPYRFTCLEASSSGASSLATNPTPRSLNMVGGVVTKPSPSSTVGPSKPPPIPAAKSASAPPSAKSKPTANKVTKPKEGFGNPARSNLTNNNVVKKRRTSGVNCTTSTTVPVTSQTVTLTAVTSAGHSLPLSFPLTIGEPFGGALSRIQVSTPLVVGRNSISLPTVVGSQGGKVTSTGKDGGVIVDVLNGQLPVTTALLHSMTVNRSSPLLATPGGGLGITLGGPGLVGQLSQLQQQSQKLTGASTMVAGSQNCIGNKNGAGIPTYGAANWSSAKLKSRSRKTNKGAVPNHATISSSLGVGLLIEGAHGGGLLTMGNSANSGGSVNSHASPSPSTSPSPLLRTDSLGSQVSSSPMANGLGLSPPHILAQKMVNSIHPPTSVSPASRTSTPSPGTDLSSPGSVGSGTKGKNIGRHVGNYQKVGGHGNLAFPLGTSINLTSLPVATVGRSSQPVTYQQVFASQMLSPEQLGQLHVQGAKPTPIKFPLLATPTGLSSTPQLLLRGGEDPRRTEDTHTLST